MNEYYIGVMSGTSLDGVDVALCEIDAASCRLIASYEHPFEKELKSKILEAITHAVTLKTIGELDVKLGVLFSDAVNALLTHHPELREKIKAIGLHGQTLWHEPTSPYPFSMQFGNANEVVARTGIDVISDFRGADIANGGEGAPFAPAFHQEIFKNLGEKIAVVNIGGIANISCLGDELLGWDIGCGNVLMDGFISLTQNKPYDKNGDFARSGELNMDLLQTMLRDDYFAKIPPKSTGREYFNSEWLQNYLQDFQSLREADMQRTLLELTTVTIANEANRLGVRELIICGGGAKNGFLMERLEKLCRAEVKTSDKYGVSSDFLEAMIFAWLAYKRIHKEAINLKSVTGAKKNAILGAHYAAN
ncbi:anhydro-N-acetylmuramic acid kinase [Sulfurimonas paralvinellae]|uniref:Anhydro-N-acetylmuramic acid kinase n=1 Tax=Sulfurimonas paralvinellae TaxID=317658 RepID=A0A7M1BA02_9BACT|nr:anhydro-N-acetylmuramic acid kinase [Sulfurimonas paralvinellae]QOP46550.1 anhydro-N-acetylmuramic acid kinase [Sulfurimonas paralvinellae]